MPLWRLLLASAICSVSGKQIPALHSIPQDRGQVPEESGEKQPTMVGKSLRNSSEKQPTLVDRRPTDVDEADRVRRAAEQAAEQAKYEEEAAKQAAERNGKAQKGIVAKIEKVRGEVKEASAELTRWRTQMRATIEEALVQQKNAVKAARDRADAEQHFAQSVEAVQKISEFAKAATSKAMQKMETADKVIEQATGRKKIAKKISDKAETEAKYYKELAEALSKQRKAVEDAASEIETAKRARAAKEAAEKKANSVFGSINIGNDPASKDPLRSMLENTTDTTSTDDLIKGLEALEDDPTDALFATQFGSKSANIQVPAKQISNLKKETGTLQ